MKCPKCGYNSFEYHNACTKCSQDLTVYKETHGLKAVVLPAEARTALAAQVTESAVETPESLEMEENSSEMFSFDLPEEEAGQEPGSNSFRDPFNFEDEAGEQGTGFGEFSFADTQSSEAEKTAPSPSSDDDDLFANLLESTSFDDDPFAGKEPAAEEPKPAVHTQPSTTASPGEFDLDSFSWEEPSPAEKQEDELGDLFEKGDSKK